MSKAIDFPRALAAHRERIAEIRQLIDEANDAPVPVEAAVLAMHQHVHSLAQNFTPPVLAYTRGEQPPPMLERLHMLGMAQGVDLSPAVAFIAAIAPELIKAYLEREIRAHYEENAVSGVTHAERCKAIAELEAKLFKLETEEEALICAALEAGLHLPRRPEANPRAVLGLTP